MEGRNGLRPTASAGGSQDFRRQHSPVLPVTYPLMSALPLAAFIGPTYDKIAAVVLGLGVIAAAWKLLKRGAKLIVMADEDFVPNVQYMKILPELAEIKLVLQDLAGQVKRDHGSSLRDDMDVVRESITAITEAVDTLGGYARENREAAAAAREAAREAQEAAGEAARAGLAAAAAAKEYAQAAAEGLTSLQVLVGTMQAHAKDDRDLARTDRDLARDAIVEAATRMEGLIAAAQRTEESGERMEASGARTEASGERIEAAGVVVAEDLAAAQKRADEVHEDEEPGTAADAASQSPDSPESAGGR